MRGSGRLAQLGEHLPYKEGVTGSSPVPPIAADLSVEGSTPVDAELLTAKHGDVLQLSPSPLTPSSSQPR